MFEPRRGKDLWASLLSKTSSYLPFFFFNALFFFMPLKNKMLFYLHVDLVFVVFRDAFVVLQLGSIFSGVI